MTDSAESRADLHSHTTASDGRLTSYQLIAAAAQRGIRVLAVTDHDTTAAHDEARKSASELGVGFIAGVEITCEAAGGEVHLLGLGVDSACERLQQLCREMQVRRLDRFKEMHARLQAAGVTFDLPPTQPGTSPSRPVMARALVAAGRAGSEDEAFARYLRKGRPGYVPHRREPVGTAIEAVQGAGGVAILAHPGLYPDGDAAIEDARRHGLDGIECLHPDHDEIHVQRYMKIARKHGMLVSGGADYHGPGHARSHFFGKRFCPADEFIRLQMAMAGRSSRTSL